MYVSPSLVGGTCWMVGGGSLWKNQGRYCLIKS
jgi:hypothetical protein